MKNFPAITKEIRDARLELCEIEAFDCTREAGCARRVKEYTGLKKKRKASVAAIEQTTTRLLLHVSSAASRSDNTRR